MTKPEINLINLFLNRPFRKLLRNPNGLARFPRLDQGLGINESGYERRLREKAARLTSIPAS
jgi:hypothetical protein